MRPLWKHGIAAATVLSTLALLLSACGGGDSTSTQSQSTPSSSAQTGSEAGAGSQAVKIVNYAFSPPSITVAKGTTVEFTNSDSTPHTATSKQSGAFDSGPIKPGKSAELTFDQPGTYAYYCVFHPFMKGTVTVE